VTEQGKTHFGFETVLDSEKQGKVRGVFDSVASKYDLMNDAMSGGLHRIWKRFAVAQLQLRKGERVLDLASGTGDLIRLMQPRVGATGMVLHTDINAAMLAEGRNTLLDHGVMTPTTQCNAEALPFADRSFDAVTIAFGLRNVTHKDLALAEMHRVLKIGGRALVLEFSRPNPLLKVPYDWYSFNILPKLGAKIAGDEASYQYLASLEISAQRPHIYTVTTQNTPLEDLCLKVFLLRSSQWLSLSAAPLRSKPKKLVAASP